MATEGASSEGLPTSPGDEKDVMQETASKVQVDRTSDSGGLDEERLRKYFVGAIDAGTTSSRFIIFDGVGEPVAQHQIEFEQKYPQSG